MNILSENNFDINNPPKGCWINYAFDKIIIGATTRSPIAFITVPFYLFWTSYAAIAVGNIFGSQFIKGTFNPSVSFVGVIFIMAIIFFWSFTFMQIFGKIEITLDEYGGKIFKGIGRVGFKKQFTWDEISSIKETHDYLDNFWSKNNEIILEGTKIIRLGREITKPRRKYIFEVLNFVLHKNTILKNF